MLKAFPRPCPEKKNDSDKNAKALTQSTSWSMISRIWASVMPMSLALSLNDSVNSTRAMNPNQQDWNEETAEASQNSWYCRTADNLVVQGVEQELF